MVPPLQEEEKKVHYKIFEKNEKIRHLGNNRSQIISFRAKTEKIFWKEFNFLRPGSAGSLCVTKL